VKRITIPGGSTPTDLVLNATGHTDLCQLKVNDSAFGKTLAFSCLSRQSAPVRKRAQLTLAALCVACLGFLVWQTIHTPGRFLSPRLVKMADGRSLKLERYEFKAGTLRYEMPDRPLARTLESILPRAVRQRIAWLQPQSVTVVSSTFPSEPMLSVAVTTHESFGGRWAVSDEEGNTFDPVVNSMMFEVLEVRAFPRHGKVLHLHFMSGEGDGTRPLADFTIPNPCPGPHPRWKPEPMPVSFEEPGLQITLQRFIADRARARTVCRFRVREGSQATLNWRPASVELSDATGNHWRPWRDSRLAPVIGEELQAGFLGALWPGEDAWKVRVEFKRLGEFPVEERLRIEHIPLPEPEEIIHPHLVKDLDGARVELSALLGSQADFNQVRQLNIERKAGWLTVVFNGRIRSLGRHLVLLEAKDDRGRSVESEGFAAEFEEPPGRSADYWPSLLNLRVPTGARELNLVLAVTQSRYAEFLAKPEQTSANSGL